ncbi:MAG TPA: ABC transporter permease, partial [Thermoanaerobaculia bacterium]|nr:ABC transporter permease [Thermoanaerobaculia bacterium]
MLTYVVRRLLYAVLTFAGITVATFALVHAVPGDPLDFYISRTGFHVSKNAVETLRRQLHLDEPLPLQYVHWFRGIVTLDLGRSIVDGRPVADRILEKLPATFELNLAAFLLSALIGVPIGLWSARHAGRRLERAAAVFFFLLYSLPSFWVALLLAQCFSVRLRLFPLFGMGETFSDHLRHLVLPVITLAYAQVAIF